MRNVVLCFIKALLGLCLFTIAMLCYCVPLDRAALSEIVHVDCTDFCVVWLVVFMGPGILPVSIPFLFSLFLECLVTDNFYVLSFYL